MGRRSFSQAEGKTYYLGNQEVGARRDGACTIWAFADSHGLRDVDFFLSAHVSALSAVRAAVVRLVPLLL